MSSVSETLEGYDMTEGKMITADEVAKFRKFLDLSQRELGRLLGVTTLTVANWEKKGLLEGRTGYSQLLMILGLFKNAKMQPNFISVAALRRMLHLCAKGFLYSYFASVKELAGFDLSLIKNRDFAGFMIALSLDMYIRSLGKMSPSQMIALELEADTAEETSLVTSPNEVLADILINGDDMF